MKKVRTFWASRNSYEKAVLVLFAAFLVCCLGYWSGRLYAGSGCHVCRLRLVQGESYILDVRTGQVQIISEGCIRFPRQAPRTSRYCAGHTANLNADFLVLSPVKDATVCYAVPDGQTMAPNGQIISRRLNEHLDCWELEVVSPRSSF